MSIELPSSFIKECEINCEAYALLLQNQLKSQTAAYEKTVHTAAQSALSLSRSKPSVMVDAYDPFNEQKVTTSLLQKLHVDSKIEGSKLRLEKSDFSSSLNFSALSLSNLKTQTEKKNSLEDLFAQTMHRACRDKIEENMLDMQALATTMAVIKTLKSLKSGRLSVLKKFDSKGLNKEFILCEETKKKLVEMLDQEFGIAKEQTDHYFENGAFVLKFLVNRGQNKILKKIITK